MACSYGTGKSAQDGDHTFHLYVRPKDPKAEQWDGARSGTQAAVDVFNADEVTVSRHLPKEVAEQSGIRLEM